MKEYLKNKKVQWVLTISVLLFVLILSSSIRLSNWDSLTDQTTGEKIPLALDPYYFLRLAETLLEEGSLVDVDNMRYPSANMPYVSEILPQAIVLIYKISNIFGDYTIQEIAIFSPVLFYFIGSLLFFILVLIITKSKSAALLSTTLLAFIPSYIFRTTAGFSDHESIGMMAFFSAMIVYLLALKYLDKEENKNIFKVALFGITSALLTAFTYASFGGVANFIFIIFPLSFLIMWLIKTRDNKEFCKKGLTFYISWFVFTPLLGIVFNYNPWIAFNRFFLGTLGLLTLLVLGFILVDFFMINKKNRWRYSLGITSVIGVLGLTLIGKNIFTLASSLWIKIFHPWTQTRVGLTIAENSQPYLVDWIAQSGTAIFFMFLVGLLYLAYELTKSIERDKNKRLIALSWIILISSILFSRISSNSIMNGTNFISQFFYIGGLLISIFLFYKACSKEKIELSPELILILTWALFTLISGRAAARIFFVITPFVCLMTGYFLFSLWKESEKDIEKETRYVVLAILIFSLVIVGFNIYNFERIASAQAPRFVPNAGSQWQESMGWVRTNTSEDSIFVHWWDYGYWIQTLGERPTVTDGGHAINFWDHLIGRYLLTTPYPNSAYSLMKSHNVSYLLIDQSDLIKYPAYSQIGNGLNNEDRFSNIPMMLLDPRQTYETRNKTIDTYVGATFVDEDIIYNQDGETIFLPSRKSSVVGVLFETSINNTLLQPKGVYIYKEERYDIPIRYVYLRGELIDFGEGVDVVISVIPSFDGSNINEGGALIYLSSKVYNSFFAQLYLLDNVFGNYNDINLAYSEDDFIIDTLKTQGVPLDEFVYYQGFRGPIKIWEVNYPKGTLAREEFLRRSGDWGDMDYLFEEDGTKN